jgi:very-short-patch-repair endonuclease
MRGAGASGSLAAMEAAEALRLVGGVGSFAEIVAMSSRRKLRTAIKNKEIAQVGRARYVLADVTRHRRRAVEAAGVLSHLSAAQHWGWKVKWTADRPWVTVPRNRKVDRKLQVTLNIVYADLPEVDVVAGVTSKLRTVIDCGRRLPFDEALAVADSAVRAGDITNAELATAAAAVRGPGATQCRRVAAEADSRAANPFESALRAIACAVDGLDVIPQEPVATSGLTYHPDLVDVARGIVLEADSWEFHTDPETWSRDCVRHSLMSARGWLVLRFTWAQVMDSPAYVRNVLEEVVRAR